jgi:hypothetical protein
VGQPDGKIHIASGGKSASAVVGTAMTRMRELTFMRLGVYLTLLLVVGLFVLGCEPGGDITFHNLQNQDVTVFFATVLADGSIDQLTKQGVISANSTKIFSAVFPSYNWVRRIEAHDPTGKVVFSHDYKMADLEKIGWKIVIPP